MGKYQLGDMESRFADLVWANEPLTSAALCKLCEEAFEWKKSTTFTVLKRLCIKGLFSNVKGTVSAVLTRDEFYSLQSEHYVDRSFQGSLPAFLAAFTKQKKLTAEDVAELRRFVDEYEEE